VVGAGEEEDPNVLFFAKGASEKRERGQTRFVVPGPSAQLGTLGSIIVETSKRPAPKGARERREVKDRASFAG